MNKDRYYTVKVLTDDTDKLFEDSFIEKLYDAGFIGSRDYIVDEVKETYTSFREQNVDGMIRECVNNEKYKLMEKFINVAKQFCNSEEDEAKFVKLLEEEFEK